MSNAKAIDEQSFTQETASGVSLVDFWAEWCGPCRMMGPAIDQVAADYEGKALVAKVDVDACQNLAVKLGVNSIPTLIIFKDGAEVKRFVGVTSKGDLGKALDAAIG
jgi:thioredoxin 1